MGDDLGDEWWAHEGDSGTFITCHLVSFGVTKAAVAGCEVCAFWDLNYAGKNPRFAHAVLAVS